MNYFTESMVNYFAKKKKKKKKRIVYYLKRWITNYFTKKCIVS